MRRLAVFMRRSRGYRVIEAEDGPPALRIASEEASTIDLLLSDVPKPFTPDRLSRKVRETLDARH